MKIVSYKKQSKNEESKKVDPTQNGESNDKISALVKKCQKRDVKLVPLQLNKRTTILVMPKNANKQYAEKKRKELGLSV